MAGLIQLLESVCYGNNERSSLKACRRYLFCQSGRFFLIRILILTTDVDYVPIPLSLVGCVVSCPTGDKAALSDGRTKAEKR
eukprot:scaffold3117_cov80-Skeletonema_marinoi.AAC.1